MENSSLVVRFYERPVLQEYESDVEGRPIHKMRDFCEVVIPGVVPNKIDTFANEEHKRRWPDLWERYLRAKERGETEGYVGTLLSDWPLLNAAIALELKHYHFHTVEQIAAASDQQIEGIGMCAGMAPHSLRDKAKAYLAKAKDGAESTHMVTELAKRDQQIADLTEMVQRLAAGQEVKKPGRPKKEAVSA